MCWTMLFLLAALLLLSAVNGSSVRIPDYCTCYNSSDPAALNASLLYDDRSDSGELWKRDDQQKPLPPCSDITDALSDGRCEVCSGEQVFAVCQRLPESVDLWMEGSRKIKISRCACDQLASKAEISTTAGTEIWPVLAAVLIFIILAAAVFSGLHPQEKNDRKTKKTQKLLP